MKQKLIALVTVASLAGSSAWAANYNRTLASESGFKHAITPSLGLSSGQVVFAFDYEYRLNNNLGFGGYMLFSPKKASKNISGVMAFGADLKAHVSIDALDLYVRPGLGFGMYDAAAGDDQTALSPLFGIGAVYRVADHIALGFERVELFNWTSDKVTPSVAAFLATCNIRF